MLNMLARQICLQNPMNFWVEVVPKKGKEAKDNIIQHQNLHTCFFDN
nr:hypothetical protein Iba_chr01dCG13950 [Ipomoea batatas]